MSGRRQVSFADTTLRTEVLGQLRNTCLWGSFRGGNCQPPGVLWIIEERLGILSRYSMNAEYNTLMRSRFYEIVRKSRVAHPSVKKALTAMPARARAFTVIEPAAPFPLDEDACTVTGFTVMPPALHPSMNSSGRPSVIVQWEYGEDCFCHSRSTAC